MSDNRPVLVVCVAKSAVRAPHVEVSSGQCWACKVPIWISDSAMDGARRTGRRPVFACMACARVVMADGATAITTERSEREVEAALGSGAAAATDRVNAMLGIAKMVNLDDKDAL